MAGFGAYAAGRDQNALEVSVQPLRPPASWFAVFMVAEALALALLKAERAVPLLELFTGSKLAKPGVSYRKHWSTSERSKNWDGWSGCLEGRVHQEGRRGAGSECCNSDT